MKVKNEDKKLYSKAVKGMSLLVAREFFIKIISIIPQILLLRILLPSDFGVFAIISFVITFAGLFSDIGLTQGIIRKKNKVTNQELSSIFYVRYFLSAVIIIAFLIFGNLATLVYKNFTSQDIFMLKIFSLTILLYPVDSIVTSLLERDLNYKAISAADIIGIIIYYLSVLFFAYHGFKAWSLIWAVFLKEVSEIVVMYHYKPWIPNFSIKFSTISDMVNFGKYLQLGNFVYFIQQSTIPFIAGIKTTTKEVGFLDWSSNITAIPRAITDNFGRVSFSGFSKIQDDITKLSFAVEKSVRYLSLFSIFFIILILAFGNELIMYVFTPIWAPALPALYWYIAGIFFFGGTTAMGQSMIVIGKTRRVLIISGVFALFDICLSIYLIFTIGFVGVALSSFLASFFLFFAYFFEGKKYGFSVSIGNILATRTLILIVSVAFAFFLNKVLPETLPSFIIKMILTSFIYLCVFYLVSRDDFRDIYYDAVNFVKKSTIKQ